MDKIFLSAQAKEVEKIYSILRQAPEIRAARIHKVKKLIDQGLYQVETGALAERMIREYLWELNWKGRF